MCLRPRFGAIAITAPVSLLVGLGSGVAIGSVLMRDTVWGLARPALISSGNQAYTVLRFLELKRMDQLHISMENEIDVTLSYLESVKKKLANDSPEWKVYERLRSYRVSHPLDHDSANSGPHSGVLSVCVRHQTT